MKTVIIRAHFLRQSRKKPGFPLQSFGRPKGFPLQSLAPHGLFAILEPARVKSDKFMRFSVMSVWSV
jgi:hypothetical protein